MSHQRSAACVNSHISSDDLSHGELASGFIHFVCLRQSHPRALTDLDLLSDSPKCSDYGHASPHLVYYDFVTVLLLK